MKRRKNNELEYQKEFHFTESKRQQLDRGKSLDETIFSLYYQIVHLGLEHEEKTGRVTLPRDIYYYKDSEDGDKLRFNSAETAAH
ncbi:hypothetical protein [Bacillus sp. V2I10]|uniref:hypothetical protein n=1 Tax=Bacillus sp. V2I10 TaxID=3042276 RepID=UPI002782329E|nr:hypothetical protein [Bacillus sp. V2I10]MDQ0861599.1 hypothetical protein [Bacillus sp. V2I10]